jgi:hypothetical protein
MIIKNNMSKLLLTEVLSINDIIAEVLKLVRKEEKQPFPECTDLFNDENPIYSYIMQT